MQRHWEKSHREVKGKGFLQAWKLIHGEEKSQVEKNSLQLFFLAFSAILLFCLSPLLPDQALALLPAFPYRATRTIACTPVVQPQWPQQPRSPASWPRPRTRQPTSPSSAILTASWLCHLLLCLIRLQTHLLVVILSSTTHPKPQLLSNGLHPISDHLLLPLYPRSILQIQTPTLLSWHHQHHQPVTHLPPPTSSG